MAGRRDDRRRLGDRAVALLHGRAAVDRAVADELQPVDGEVGLGAEPVDHVGERGVAVAERVLDVVRRGRPARPVRPAASSRAAVMPGRASVTRSRRRAAVGALAGQQVVVHLDDDPAARRHRDARGPRTSPARRRPVPRRRSTARCAAGRRCRRRCRRSRSSPARARRRPAPRPSRPARAAPGTGSRGAPSRAGPAARRRRSRRSRSAAAGRAGSSGSRRCPCPPRSACTARSARRRGTAPPPAAAPQRAPRPSGCGRGPPRRRSPAPRAPRRRRGRPGAPSRRARTPSAAREHAEGGRDREGASGHDRRVGPGRPAGAHFRAVPPGGSGGCCTLVRVLWSRADRVLDASRHRDLTYAEVGATARSSLPDGYHHVTPSRASSAAAPRRSRRRPRR